MDHVIEYIENYMNCDEEQFIKEFKSGNYKKMSDCPSYKRVKAYCDCINVLVKANYREEYVENYLITPKEIISRADD